MLFNAVSNAAAESLMPADGIAGNEVDHNDFKDENSHGNVEQTEQQLIGCAEVEHKQEHIIQCRLGVATELFSYRLREVSSIAIALTQSGHETLELRRNALLLISVVDIRPLYETLPEMTFGRYLVVEFLLALHIVEFTAFLALQEEEVGLYIIVGNALLGSDTDQARDSCQDENRNGGNGHRGGRVTESK